MKPLDVVADGNCHMLRKLGHGEKTHTIKAKPAGREKNKNSKSRCKVVSDAESGTNGKNYPYWWTVGKHEHEEARTHGLLE